VPQGGVFVVRLRNAPPEPTPVVFFSGVSHAMLLQAQLWWAVIGVAANFPPGQQAVQISTDTGADGLPIVTVTVNDAAFPEENIDLPPETSQLLTDAPAIQDGTQILESVCRPHPRAQLVGAVHHAAGASGRHLRHEAQLQRA
jgi:hypothetical protein